MQQSKELYFDLSDLGTGIFIKNIEYYHSNGINFDILGHIDLKINTKGIDKDFNMPKEAKINFKINPFIKDGLDCILFKCNEFDSVINEEYERDGFEEKAIFFANDADEGLTDVHINKNLLNFFSAYATVQFFKRFGLSFNVEKAQQSFQVLNRYAISSNIEDLYVICYLVVFNYEKLAKYKESLMGSDIDYPTRDYISYIERMSKKKEQENAEKDKKEFEKKKEDK